MRLIDIKNVKKIGSTSTKTATLPMPISVEAKLFYTEKDAANKIKLIEKIQEGDVLGITIQSARSGGYGDGWLLNGDGKKLTTYYLDELADEEDGVNDHLFYCRALEAIHDYLSIRATEIHTLLVGSNRHKFASVKFTIDLKSDAIIPDTVAEVREK